MATPWLTILWAVPMFGAAVVILLPSAARGLAKYLSLALSLTVLASTSGFAAGFDPAGDKHRFVADHAVIHSCAPAAISVCD